MQNLILVLITCTVCYGMPVNTVAYNLPEIGNSYHRVLSPVNERKLGERYMEQIRSYGIEYYDPLIADYLQQLTTPLHNNLTEQNYIFFVVRNPTINAFAMPGGYIGIHTGLIQATQNESELAAVLAHEMAHISQRHMARFFERAQQQLLPTIAAMMGSALLASQDPSAGIAALTASMAGAQQATINFTRDNEEEADRVGMEILQASGFDPHGMPNFFNRLWAANRYNPSNLPEFLRTHPVTEARIADTQQRALRYKNTAHKDSINFLLAKARIDFLATQHTQPPLANYQANLAKTTDPKTNALRYSNVLKLMAAAKYSQAQEDITFLLQTDPSNIFYRLAATEILVYRQQSSTARNLLQEIYASVPNSQAAALYYAQHVLSNQNYPLACDILRRFVKKHPANITALNLLAEAQGQSGQAIAAYQTRADILVLYGDFRGAIKQLEYALRDKKNNKYTTLALQARIKQLQTAAAAREKNPL